jgi:hypothetical protein
MDWKLITNSKFFASGLVRFDDASKQFKDARDIGLVTPAIYSLKGLLNIASDAEFTNNSLILEFDAAVAFALSAERNFLLDKFNQAYSKLKELSQSNPTNGLVMIAPAGTVAEYASEAQFVYAVKQDSDDSFYFSNRIQDKDDAGCSYIYYIFNGVTPNE